MTLLLRSDRIRIHHLLFSVGSINVLTGDSFNFTDATLVLTGDAELLDKSVTYILATATESITGVPTVDNAPKGWSVSIRGRNLLFSCRHGMKVSIR